MNQTAAHRVSDAIARLDKKPTMRNWRVTQGPSKGTVAAATHAEAVIRAVQLGFSKPDSIVLIEPPRPHQCRNEHEALGMALGMLNRIAEGRSYDAAEYFARVEELKLHYDREQQRLEATRPAGYVDPNAPTCCAEHAQWGGHCK